MDSSPTDSHRGVEVLRNDVLRLRDQLNRHAVERASLLLMVKTMAKRSYEILERLFELSVERDMYYQLAFPEAPLPSMHSSKDCLTVAGLLDTISQIEMRLDEPMTSQSADCDDMDTDYVVADKNSMILPANPITLANFWFLRTPDYQQLIKYSVVEYEGKTHFLASMAALGEKEVYTGYAHGQTRKIALYHAAHHLLTKLDEKKLMSYMLDEEMVSQSNDGGLNPPIPKTEGSTGATFTSTDVDTLPVSKIGQDGAGPMEGKKHAGVSGSLDFYMKNQFLGLSTFTWSVNDLPGAVKFAAPIAPKNANYIISYLSGMFNCWAGGLDYEMKVAGTALHAGALGITRIPPNIDYRKLKTVNNFTAFEYSVIDPKTLEAVNRHVTDQRPIMYHYMNADTQDPNSIGGTIVVFVMLQLNTASSGTNQIDVQIFNKASHDFEMFQIIPPTVSDVIDDEAKWSLLFPQVSTDPLSGRAITTMRAFNSGGPTPYGPALRSSNGALTSTIGVVPYCKLPTTPQISNGPYMFKAESSTVMVPLGFDGAIYNQPITISGPSLKFIPTSGTALIDFPSSASLTGPIVVTAATTNAYYSFGSTTYAVFTWNGIPTLDPPSDESFVFFDSDTGPSTKNSNLTTLNISNLVETQSFALPAGQSALLSVTSRYSGLEIAQIKYHPNGTFTAPRQNLNIPWGSFDVDFLQYVATNAAFASPTQQMMSARAMHEMFLRNAGW